MRISNHFSFIEMTIIFVNLLQRTEENLFFFYLYKTIANWYISTIIHQFLRKRHNIISFTWCIKFATKFVTPKKHQSNYKVYS